MDLVQVNTKFLPREVEGIDHAVEKGHAINRSDFVRDAVKEKLDSLKQGA